LNPILKETDDAFDPAAHVTLPSEMAARVKAKVASGEYASESEVIREGPREE
jgi:Arc/MetJ-type ribon-helix-helix transcriptional regulator